VYLREEKSVHDHGRSPNVENYSGGDPLPPVTLKNVEN
jgi:hypothetical protein